MLSDVDIRQILYLHPHLVKATKGIKEVQIFEKVLHSQLADGDPAPLN